MVHASSGDRLRGDPIVDRGAKARLLSGRCTLQLSAGASVQATVSTDDREHRTASPTSARACDRRRLRAATVVVPLLFEPYGI